MTTNGGDRPLGPFKLVTVNTAPERAKRIVGRLCEEIKDSYLIDYVANSTSEHPGERMQRTPPPARLTIVHADIDGVRAMVEEHKPDILVRTHNPDEHLDPLTARGTMLEQASHGLIGKVEARCLTFTRTVHGVDVDSRGGATNRLDREGSGAGSEDHVDPTGLAG